MYDHTYSLSRLSGGHLKSGINMMNPKCRKPHISIRMAKRDGIIVDKYNIHNEVSGGNLGRHGILGSVHVFSTRRGIEIYPISQVHDRDAFSGRGDRSRSNPGEYNVWSESGDLKGKMSKETDKEFWRSGTEPVHCWSGRENVLDVRFTNSKSYPEIRIRFRLPKTFSTQISHYDGTIVEEKDSARDILVTV